MNRSFAIFFTHQKDEAIAKTKQGFEPIECAFGSSESVIGPLCMDHHGSESWREGVALRACRDHYGARSSDPRFVVTGTPDADAILAIVALAALVPFERIPKGFYTLVNRHDIDPIRLNLLDEPFGEELLFFQQIQNLRRDQPSFSRAVQAMKELLAFGITSSSKTNVRKKESRRIMLAETCTQELVGNDVLFIESKVWGFDRWYRKAPLVVSYSQRFQSMTIGCRHKDKAEELFGKGGLLNVFPLLGEDWGGRESIGGSPRGKTFSIDQARDVAQKISDLILRIQHRL